MSSAAISVLQERCAVLSEQLIAKDESEAKLRVTLETFEERHQAELAGLKLELETTKSTLKKELNEKKALKAEWVALEALMSTSQKEMRVTIADAVHRSTIDFREREQEVTEQLNICRQHLASSKLETKRYTMSIFLSQ